ncbi:MAG: bacillolysin [Paraglaciecola sp.]|jgi:bacillolysin
MDFKMLKINYSHPKFTIRSFAAMSILVGIYSPTLFAKDTDITSLLSKNNQKTTSITAYQNKSKTLKKHPNSRISKGASKGKSYDPIAAGKELVTNLTHKKNTSTKPSTKGVATTVSSSQRKNLKELNQQSTGGAKVLFDDFHGTPTFIKPFGKNINIHKSSKAKVTSKLVERLEDKPMKFMEENKALLKINNPKDEFKLVKKEADSFASNHFTYQQVINEIPVFGKEIKLHLNKKNDVYLFQGRFIGSTNIQLPQNILSKDDAIKATYSAMQFNEKPYSEPEVQKTYYVAEKGEPILTYQVDYFPLLHERWTIFVDAVTGEVVHKLNRIHQNITESTGVDLNGQTRQFNSWFDKESDQYYLIDPSTPTLESNSDPISEGAQSIGDTYIYDNQNTTNSDAKTYVKSDSVSIWQDPVAVSTAFNTRLVYDYYKNTFDRKSIDNKNKNLLAVIHYDLNLDNAFWNGTYMVYGDGGDEFTPIAGCLDVVAHEMTHGVIEHTANLAYEFQSGALNESFSDVFAVLVDDDDWLLGEDCTLGNLGYLRNLQDPNLNGQPKHMNEYQNLPYGSDNGGVHINSGIPNRAAYLIMEGLTKEGLGTSVGRGSAERIYYRALRFYLTRYSQFIDARNALIQSAIDLYGNDSLEVKAVSAAFNAVGIVEEDAFDSTPTSTDPIDAEDVMIYLYPEDGTHDNSSDENYFLYTQKMKSNFSGYIESNDIGPYNKESDGDIKAYYSKPTAFSDTYLYIGIDHNIYWANLDSKDWKITTSGIYASISMSPDLKFVAYTTTDATDSNIYLMGLLDSENVQTYPIKRETYQENDESTVSNVLYVDSLSFDYTSSYIAFDMLSCINTPTESCDAGDGLRYWSIGVLDIERGNVFFPFQDQLTDYEFGYPTFAANNNTKITADFIDFSEYQETGLVNSSVITIDFDKQEATYAHTFEPYETAQWGVPSFWGEDNYLTFQSGYLEEGEVRINAVRKPVNEDWQAFGLTEVVNPYDVAMPFMYREGFRIVTRLLFADDSSLKFGDVFIGEEKELQVNFTAYGNTDVEIESISISGEGFTHNGNNIRIPRGQTYQLKVYYSPNNFGTVIGNLELHLRGGSSIVVALTGFGSQPETEPPIAFATQYDFTGDGKADVLWRNMKDGRVYLRFMDGLKLLKGNVIGEAPFEWSIVGQGDFNGDNKSDVLWRNNRTGSNYIWIMDGDTVTEGQTINTIADLNWQIKAVADFNGDSKSDILWHHQKTGQTYVYLMDGFQILARSSVRYVGDVNWQIQETTDVNADGKSDVIWRHQLTGVNYIWLMDGYTLEQGYVLNTVAGAWDIVGAGDLNGDGHGDIVWRNPVDGRNWAYLMKDGQIELSRQINTISGTEWQIKSIADFDGDGKADIFWHNQTTGLTYVYLMDGAAISSRGALNTVNSDWQVIGK